MEVALWTIFARFELVLAPSAMAMPLIHLQAAEKKRSYELREPPPRKMWFELFRVRLWIIVLGFRSIVRCV